MNFIQSSNNAVLLIIFVELSNTCTCAQHQHLVFGAQIKLVDDKSFLVKYVKCVVFHAHEQVSYFN